MIMFWATLLAVSILLYVLLDGFDLGVGILFGLTGSETRRSAMLAAVAPNWDGNETLFDVEYADVLGIPFDFTAKPVPAPPQPPRETIQVKAMRPERDVLEIRFPRIAVGNFKPAGDSYTGVIKTLTFNTEAVFEPIEKKSEKSPDYRVTMAKPTSAWRGRKPARRATLSCAM